MSHAPVPDQDASPIPEVEETLASLEEQLPEVDRAVLSRNMTLIPILIQPADSFSIESFILSEVARALCD